MKNYNPWVSASLVLICFFLQVFVSPETKAGLLTTPYDLLFHFNLNHLYHALLSGFLHANWGHFISNTIFLVFLGWVLEKRIGNLKMLGLYLASGLGALIFHVLSNPLSPFPFLGASGYVFGLFVAYALLA